MALKAYFDESGTHDNAPVTLIGGLMGEAANWSTLVRDWNALLGKRHIDYYHTTELTRMLNDSGKTYVLDDCKKEFADAIFNSGLLPIAYLVTRDAWEYALHNLPQITKGFPKAYDMCFLGSVLQAAAWPTPWKRPTGPPPKVPLELIYSDTDEYRKRSLKVFNNVKAKHKEVAPFMGSIDYVPMDKEPGLQAADLWCGEVYAKQIFFESKGKGKKPYTPLVDQFVKADQIGSGGIVTKKVMRAYLRTVPPLDTTIRKASWVFGPSDKSR